MQFNAPFPTRSRAEAYLQARPTPTPPELAAFVARQPRVLPLTPTRPADSRAYRLAIAALLVVFVLLVVLVLALAFFLFGEEHPERVRPSLTPAQRVRALRL